MAHPHDATRDPWTLLIAASLAAAGALHWFLTPEHMAMSAIFGAGFLVAGVAQFAMAGLAMIRPTGLLYAAVIASTVVLSGMYAYNALVGLPFHEDAGVAASLHDKHSAEGAHEEESGGESHRNQPDGHDGDVAETDHHEGGLVAGGGEPVDGYGAVTQLAQLTAAGVALALVRRTNSA